MLRRCAPNPCHKHIHFNDFHGSVLGPNEELNQKIMIFQILLWRLAKTLKSANSFAGVPFGEHPGANFEKSWASVGANSIFTTNADRKSWFVIIRR